MAMGNEDFKRGEAVNAGILPTHRRGRLCH